MIALSILISILLLPIYSLSILVLYILKHIIHTILKLKFKSDLQLLDSADTYWAVGEDYHNLSSILIIVKKKPHSDIAEEMRKIMEEKLFKSEEKYRKILSSLHRFLGYPYLLKGKFRADDFLTIIDTDETQFTSIEDIIHDYGNKPLKNGNLWEILIINASEQWKEREGMKIDQIPIILRENHCLTDGLSLMNLIANSFGDDTVDLSSYLKNIPNTRKSNRIVTILGNVFLLFLAPGWFIVENIQRKTNKRLWKSPDIVYKPNIAYRSEKVGGKMVQYVKALKREIGNTSFTEILMTAISASLHRHFLKNCNSVSESLILLVVATKDLKPMTVDGVPILRNQFGMLNFELPIKIDSDSMLERLEALKKKTRPLLKSPAFPINTFVFFNLMSVFPVPVIRRLFPMSEAAGISNLPGFPEIAICNGHNIENVYFFLPQRDQNGIGFSVLTYDDRLHIGLTADEASVPSKAHCAEIVDDIFEAIKNLGLEIARKKQDTKTIDIDCD